jgi:hypothetical protein
MESKRASPVLQWVWTSHVGHPFDAGYLPTIAGPTSSDVPFPLVSTPMDSLRVQVFSQETNGCETTQLTRLLDTCARELRSIEPIDEVLACGLYHFFGDDLELVGKCPTK